MRIDSCGGTLNCAAEAPRTIALEPLLKAADGSSSLHGASSRVFLVGSKALKVTIFRRQSLELSVAPYEHSRAFLTHLEQQGLASSHYNKLSFMLQETWIKRQLLSDKWPECWVDQGHQERPP